MADTQNDQQNANNPTAATNPQVSLTSTPPTQSFDSPTNTPAVPAHPAATKDGVDTGAEYETNELAPEDLDSRWLRWKCAVCNYTYEGVKPLKKCPRCGNEDQDKFLDAD